MKKSILTLALAFAAFVTVPDASAVGLQAAAPSSASATVPDASVVGQQASDVMRKTDDGTYIVNTTTLCNARGYRAATPVEVYIKDGKVVKVAALRNQETPSFFERVKRNLLPLYNNKKLSRAMKQTASPKVDGCTGATISTRAVQANIKAALEYYQAHRKSNK